MGFELGESRILVGDCLDALMHVESDSVHCVVTSPPYWGLRSYLPGEHPDKDRELGMESTPEAYVERLVARMREVRRVLHPSGTLWLNLGDCYAGSGGYAPDAPSNRARAAGDEQAWGAFHSASSERLGSRTYRPGAKSDAGKLGLKPKDLVGVPWMVAFALRADGWWLRSESIWAKGISGAYQGGSAMPESALDRPSRSHEHLFLLTKSERYFYDQHAVREKALQPTGRAAPSGGHSFDELRASGTKTNQGTSTSTLGTNQGEATRNLRSVLHVNPEAFGGAHFATMPPALALLCIRAGSSPHGCCPRCRAPYERIVEREATEYNEKEARQQRRRCAGAIGGGTERVTLGKTDKVRRETVGWERTCSCRPMSPARCRVLDPFAGSGTTGLVAVRNGRDFVGVELNDEYAEMARRRIERPESFGRPREEDPRQTKLFE